MLRAAAYYLEFTPGEPGEGQKVRAEEFAQDKCKFADTRSVRTAVSWAKTVNYGPWSWWDIALQMARKGKLEQLHRAY